MSARTKLILGLVGAAAVGVAVGILLAPETGVNTRKKIATTAGDWGSSLGDLFTSAKESVGKVRRKGSELASQAADRYSHVKESYS
ncbi:MAG TPA: YtxH domain-containing protein [Flavisolibacter sp.]|nr:YtxH domain-containing protein [Flavisolibacter sp.]